MRLHHNKGLFQDAVQATAQQLSIPEVYIEKDYWVSLILHEIFSSNISDQIVFKGGTALSKCHRLIQRFSEDIDLVILRNAREPENQLKKRIRTVSKIVDKILPEKHVEGLTNKRGNIRKTAHQYDKIFDGELGQVAELLVLEVTWLGSFEPYTIQNIGSYIFDFLSFKKQDSLIEEYGMEPFDAQVLSIERTFCEKIMSLVRFSHIEDPITMLPNKVRHIYDLHLMLKNKDLLSFFNSDSFSKMLLKVGQDDFISFKSNNEWLKKHPSSAIIFESPKKVWTPIKRTYQTSFKRMVFGQFPNEADLFASLKKIKKRIQPIDWQIRS